MMPAATTHQVPQTQCEPQALCWMPGLGFRWIKDTGAACAIDDAPLAAKATCASALGVLLTSCEADQRGWGMVDYPDPAPVPLPTSASLMLLALALLLAPKAWRAAGRFAEWFTAERGGDWDGTKPHLNGWVGGPEDR